MASSLSERPKTIKDGFSTPNVRDSHFIRRFTAISRSLMDSKSLSASISLDEASLATVSSQLQVFMMTAIGKNSPLSARVMTKIPKSCFEDYSVDGSLSSILFVALKHCENAKWADFNLDKSERYCDGIAILQAIGATLLKDGKLKKMKFFFREVDAEHIPELSQQIQSHGGYIVDTIGEASHVLKWDNEIDKLPSKMDCNFVRILSSSNNDVKENGMEIEKELPTINKSLVHWIYYPDSYDEYVESENIIHCANKPDTDTHNVEKILALEIKEPDVIVTAESSVLLSTTKKWFVNCQFVTSCDIFNEWGNEKDFEMKLDELNKCDKYVRTDSASESETKSTKESILIKVEDGTVVAPISAAATAAATGAATAAAATVGTGAATAAATTVGTAAATAATTTVGTGAIKVTATEGLPIPTSISVTSLSNLGNGIKRKADGIEENTNVVSIKQKKNSKKSSQSLLKLPAWFKFDSVNYLEIRNLPEFFTKNKISAQTEMEKGIENSENNNLKTEEYIKTRNFIVNLYSQNPFVYLSATECRKKISGDVCMILRIHSFLDTSSLINFNVKADCRPTLSSTSFSNIPTVIPIQASSSVSSLTSMTGVPSINPTNISTLIPLVSYGLSEDQSTANTTSISAIQGPDFMSKIVENSRPVSIPDFVTEDEDGWFGDWTDRMDEILLQLTSETQGDWNSISKKINEEVANMNINEDMTINWIDCIVRLICLPIIRSASTTKSQNGNLGFPRNSSTQQNLLLSSQIARQGVKALGYDQAQKVVVGAANLLNEEVDMVIVKKVSLSKKEMKIILALTCASVSANAWKEAEIEKSRLNLLLNDYIAYRLTALEEKMKLLVDVDRMIDIEKERLEVDRRDSQIQRAQLAFQLSGQLGL